MGTKAPVYVGEGGHPYPRGVMEMPLGGEGTPKLSPWEILDFAAELKNHRKKFGQKMVLQV